MRNIIRCDRCCLQKEYQEEYLFNDGIFFGDNGDREVFKADEIVCVNCIGD